jgi:hypothetical protein
MGRLWAGVRDFGYYYHLPVAVPLVTFAAAALVELGRAARTSRVRWAVPAVAALAVLVVALTALSVPDKVRANLAVRDDYRALQRFVADRHLGTAVLLLPYRGDLGFVGTSPFLENSPTLDQPLLYAAQRGARDLEVADRFPDRPLYRLEQDLPPGRTTGGRLTLQRLGVQAGPTVTLRLHLTDPTGSPRVAATLQTDDRTTSRTLDGAPAAGGGRDVEWTLVPPGGSAPAGTPPEQVVPLPPGTASGVLSAGLAAYAADGAGRAWAQRIAWRLTDGGSRVEVLLPGEGWAQADAPDGPWAPQAAGNPVALR